MWEQPRDTHSSRPPATAWWSVLRRAGLRAKFNAALVPLVAAALSVLVFLDYAHEFRSVMDAHGIHAGRVDAAVVMAPMPQRTTPDAVARRAIALHAVAGAFTLIALVLAINLTLSRFVLAPLSRVRAGIDRLQRGFRTGEGVTAAPDQVRDVVHAFDALGLTLDAALLHALQTERLATLALLSKIIAAEIEPEVQRLGIAATRLHQVQDDAVHEAAHEIAEATARILATVRGLDRPFAQIAHKPAA